MFADSNNTKLRDCNPLSVSLVSDPNSLVSSTVDPKEMLALPITIEPELTLFL